MFVCVGDVRGGTGDGGGCSGGGTNIYIDKNKGYFGRWDGVG